MKSRPILFSSPMVRAILAGQKTVTRRLVNSRFRCEPGDQLWVRETVMRFGDSFGYKADLDHCGQVPVFDNEIRKIVCRTPKDNWTPSILMPRAASRITLHVVEVHQEPLHEIDDVGAIDEGMLTLGRNAEFMRRHFREYWEAFEEYHEKRPEGVKPPLGPGPLKRFKALWCELNGQESWDANPMVWVVRFTSSWGGDATTD